LGGIGGVRQLHIRYLALSTIGNSSKRRSTMTQLEFIAASAFGMVLLAARCDAQTGPAASTASLSRRWAGTRS